MAASLPPLQTKMLAPFFLDIETQEALLTRMDEFVLYGGWAYIATIPLAYAFLSDETAYEFLTFQTTFYVIAVWAQVVRILCKSTT
jgi:hypothetical protein